MPNSLNPKQSRAAETPEEDSARDAPNYETAVQQLEEILDKMNGTIALEESVVLYERADYLLQVCAKKLSEAENKIEMLVKNRSGEVQFGGDGRPQIKTVEPSAPTSTIDRQPESTADQFPF